MPEVRVVETTSLESARVLEAARDFSDRRAQLWPDVHVEHLTVHERGDTWAEVTEGNPWPIGFVWERLRYDGSVPDRLSGVVVDGNIFKPGSSWALSTAPADSRRAVEVHAVRHLTGFRGRLLYPAFPLGLAKRDVAAHLHHFLAHIEDSPTLR